MLIFPPMAESQRRVSFFRGNILCAQVVEKEREGMGEQANYAEQ